MSRRIARILAFQSLYSWNVGGINIEDLLSFSWIERDTYEDDDVEAKAPVEQVLEEKDGGSANPEPINEVKYGLMENQLKGFENLSADKKNEVFSFTRILVNGVIENIQEIDDLIKSHLAEKWSIDRINKVALSVMRVAVYELLYHKDTPATIVIDEAVEIVKDYGSDDSHRFTNAILDKISKDIANKN